MYLVAHTQGAKLPVFLTLAIVLMLCAPGLIRAAFAQGQPVAPARGADPRETASFRVGFLYLTPSLFLDRVGYDSNVLNQADDRKADFTMRVTPRSMVWIPFARRALLTADLGVGMLYYKNTTSQRSVSPRINAVGEVYARRLTLSAEAGTVRDVRQPNIEIETRATQVNDTLGIGARVDLQRGLSVGLAGYRWTNRYDADAVLRGIKLGEQLDRVEQGIRVTVREQLTSFTAVGVIFETRSDRFDRAVDRNADGYRLAGTIDLAPKALIAGTAEVGYRHAKSLDPTVPSFDGLVAKVAISNRLAGVWETRLTWDRDMQYSLTEARPYFLMTDLFIRVGRRLAGQFDASLGSGRTRSTYQDRLGVSPASRDRERVTTYNLDIGYRLTRDSRLAFGVTRNTRTSSLADTRRYSTTFAGLSLNYVF